MLSGPEKIEVIRDHARHYPRRVFIETGTASGDTPYALRDEFERLFTIDIAEDNYTTAVLKFLDVPNVQVILGDSDPWVNRIVHHVTEPCLFWLDAHYDHDGRDDRRGAVDTPIRKELAHIFHTKREHVILIDDARLFGTDPSYPTIDELRRITSGGYPTSTFTVEDDIIRILPK